MHVLSGNCAINLSVYQSLAGQQQQQQQRPPHPVPSSIVVIMPLISRL